MINILALQYFTFFIHFHNLPTTCVQQTQTTDDLRCLHANIIRKTFENGCNATESFLKPIIFCVHCHTTSIPVRVYS